MMMTLAQLAGNDAEWANTTTLHPLAALGVMVCAVWILWAKRTSVPIPVLLAICFISPAQRVVVGGLDFSLIRVLVLVGALRVLYRREYKGLKWNVLDALACLWALSGALIYTLQYGTVAAFVYKCGVALESLGMYFLFRVWIRDWDDTVRFAGYVARISIPVAVALLIERSTGRNVFAVFGGVPAITAVREGKLRAQGAFSHAILAGTFWAVLWPLVATLWWRTGYRIFAVIGTMSICAIIVACASSTPIGVLGAAVSAMFVWRVRRNIRAMCVALGAVLVVAHIVMDAPVWHLFARIDLVGGSTGWHRYLLIDNAIKHFGEWALLGVQSTRHWGHSQQDVTNQYIIEGVRGGVLTMLLFVGMIVVAFISIGEMLAQACRDRRLADERVSFALGVCLFANCVAFFGVSYFGQIVVIWHGLLGIVSSLRYDAWARVKATRPSKPVSRKAVTHAAT